MVSRIFPRVDKDARQFRPRLVSHTRVQRRPPRHTQKNRERDIHDELVIWSCLARNNPQGRPGDIVIYARMSDKTRARSDKVELVQKCLRYYQSSDRMDYATAGCARVESCWCFCNCQL